MSLFSAVLCKSIKIIMINKRQLKPNVYSVHLSIYPKSEENWMKSNFNPQNDSSTELLTVCIRLHSYSHLCIPYWHVLMQKLRDFFYLCMSFLLLFGFLFVSLFVIWFPLCMNAVNLIATCLHSHFISPQWTNSNARENLFSKHLIELKILITILNDGVAWCFLFVWTVNIPK